MRLHPPGSRSGPASAGKAEKQNAAKVEHDAALIGERGRACQRVPVERAMQSNSLSRQSEDQAQTRFDPTERRVGNTTGPL